MKLTSKMLAVVAAVALLTACETAPNANGGAGANGGANGGMHDGSMGQLAPNVGDRVFFDFNSSVVGAEGQATLQAQADWLKRNPSITVTVEGHCDERGTREYNLALGERRANAAKSYLVSLGVSPSRIHVISYGKERPAVTGSDESAWSQNRRAVTVVGQ